MKPTVTVLMHVWYHFKEKRLVTTTAMSAFPLLVALIEAEETLGESRHRRYV